jgi:hypothetical protein
MPVMGRIVDKAVSSMQASSTILPRRSICSALPRSCEMLILDDDDCGFFLTSRGANL